MQYQKNARGFRQPSSGGQDFQFNGTIRAKLQQVKQRTRCHICREFGHWKRECPKKDVASEKGKATVKVGSAGKFAQETMVADLRRFEYEQHMDYEAQELRESLSHEVFFTEDAIREVDALIAQHDAGASGSGTVGETEGGSQSSFPEIFQVAANPSESEAYMCELSTHAVPDTACRKTLVGEDVLKSIDVELGKRGLVSKRIEEKNVFRFGNNEVLSSVETVFLPVQFGNKSVIIKAAVLPGKGSVTPLLLSKELLKQLDARINVGSGKVYFGTLGTGVDMGQTHRGHFAIPLFADLKGNGCDVDVQMSDELMMECTSHTTQQCSAQGQATEAPKSEPSQCQKHVQFEAHEQGPGRAAVNQQVAAEPLSGGGSGLEELGQPSRQARRRARKRQVRKQNSGNREAQGKECGGDLPESETICGLDQGACQRKAEVPHNDPGVEGLHPHARQQEAGTNREGEASQVEGIEDSRTCTIYVNESSRPTCSECEANNSGVRLGRSDGPSERQGRSVYQHVGECDGEDACGAQGSESSRSSPSEQLQTSVAGHDESVLSGCERMTKNERRQVRRCLENLLEKDKKRVDVFHVSLDGKQDVAEVFSTPHITAVAQRLGLRANIALDIKNGWDLTYKKKQREVIKMLHEQDPELLVVSPPCELMSTLQRLRKIKDDHYYELLGKAKELLRFAMLLCHIQHKRGRTFVHEHPLYATSWDEPEVREVLDLPGVVRVRADQCMFGLRDAVSRLRHRKSTGIMTNCSEIAERLNVQCDKMHEHEPIWGAVKTKHGYVRRSRLAQHYPKKFVHAILAGFLERRMNENKERQIATVYAVEILSKETDDQKILVALKRAHENLGHPSLSRFMTLLKSARASEQTLRLAKEMKCETCSQKATPPSRPVSRVKKTWEFNQQIMVDTFEVEVLNKTLKLLNVVDEATAYQLCAPLWHVSLPRTLERATGRTGNDRQEHRYVFSRTTDMSSRETLFVDLMPMEVSGIPLLLMPPIKMVCVNVGEAYGNVRLRSQ